MLENGTRHLRPRRALALRPVACGSHVGGQANNQPNELYASFRQLDGSHPWQDAVPDGFVLYPVRELKRATVTYFNYELAKEMGLIPEDHPNQMTPRLEAEVCKAFGDSNY